MADRPAQMPSRHVSRVIRTSAERVWSFAADPENLPRWAAGLVQSAVRHDGDVLRVDSPTGVVTVRFVPANTLGVLDHTVTLPDGTVTLNPVRVVAHPDGAEIVFTVRQLTLTDEEFERDCATVAADLERLAGLLER